MITCCTCCNVLEITAPCGTAEFSSANTDSSPPTRFLANFLFFRDGLEPAAARVRAYHAGTSGGVLDEPATVRALMNFLLRGLWCGAVTEAELEALTGISVWR